MSVLIYYAVMDGKMTSKDMTLLGLRQYLSEHGMSEDIPCQTVTIGQGLPHKKPYFVEYPEIFHNVSHSGSWWVCAYGLTENGLDLQKVANSKTDRIAARFFHPREAQWLKEQEKEEFYRIWAYNESYIKWKGDGLTEGLSYFSVVPAMENGENSEEFHLGASDVCQQEIPFVEEDYYLVLTTKEKEEIILKKLEL